MNKHCTDGYGYELFPSAPRGASRPRLSPRTLKPRLRRYKLEHEVVGEVFYDIYARAILERVQP